ncbi:hypothetical protein DERP_001166 [Dermatophagoides pteronyssinus]|uniref:Uncharacterized protein n=1 Tax=Dermatophagoides pteronyssinus TaxID=6956 RepID=A0ABQ8JE76_DERPT|nr:hypothetical protein DERP_001166 [Dermatophagoides pteronyssinus]
MNQIKLKIVPKEKNNASSSSHHIYMCVFVDDVGIPLTGIHYGLLKSFMFIVEVENSLLFRLHICDDDDDDDSIIFKSIHKKRHHQQQYE